MKMGLKNVILLRGYVHFPKEYVGDVLTMEDGKMFTVFRRLKVDGKGITLTTWRFLK